MPVALTQLNRARRATTLTTTLTTTLASLGLVALSFSTAFADEVGPDNTAVELSHRVDATVRGDLATLDVERRLVNRDDKSKLIWLTTTLPTNSVMKKLSVQNGDGSFSEATFVARDKTRSVRPVAKPGVAAVVTAWGRGEMEIKLFPVAKAQEVSIRYQLETVVHRHNGRSQFVYPSASDGMMPVRINVSVETNDGPTQAASGPVVVDGRVGSKNQTLSRYVGGVTAGVGKVAIVPLNVPAGMVEASADTHITILASFADDNAVEMALINPAGRVQRISNPTEEERLVTVLPALLDPSEVVGQWSLQLAADSGSDGSILHRWRFHSAGKTVQSASKATQLSDAALEDDSDVWPGYDGAERKIEIGPGPVRVDTLALTSTFAGRLSIVPIDGGKALSRLHMDVPDRLSEMPTDLRVVFVLDLSRSRHQRHLKRDLAIIREYLTKAPDTRVELVVFNRFARRVFGSFVSAHDAAIRIDALTDKQLKLKNGSNVLSAALAARRALANETGNRRVVLFSDGLMRTAFTIAPVVSALVSRADTQPAPIVHIVETGNGGDGINPTHSLARLAVEFGGSSESISSDPSDPGFARGVLGLIRPIRLDSIALGGPLKKHVGLPTSIDEGQSIRLSHIATVDPARKSGVAKVSARLWQAPVSLHLRSTDRGRLAAAFAFAATQEYGMTFDKLTLEERTKLALIGRVVSASTALVLARRGVRLPDDSGTTGIGWGHTTSCGFSGILVYGPAPTVEEFAAPIEKCTVDGVQPTTTFSIETTKDEIVAVKVDSSDKRFGQCLTEALWAHQLSSGGSKTAKKHEFSLPAVVPSPLQ